MKRLLCLFALCLSAAAAEPHWLRSARIVSVRHPERPFVEAQLQKQLEDLKASGVNVIEDHGAMQFVPNLKAPTTRAQWKTPVNYAVAEPFSLLVKRLGFRLIHHTTSTFVPIDAMEHPEYRPWFSCDLRTGKTALRPAGTAYSDAVFMDLNHPGFRACIFPRMAEYARRCQIDLFQTDEVEWLPDIYACGSPEGSQKLYRERIGALPTGKYDLGSVAWRRYVEFRYASGRDFYRALLAALRAVNPDMGISGCLAGISGGGPWRNEWGIGNSAWLSGLTVGFHELEVAHHPKGKRGGYMSPSFAPAYYAEMGLYDAFYEAYGWDAVYAIGYPATWKKPDSEQFFLWALTSLMGYRYEMRDYQAEPEWFAWEARHEKDLLGPRFIADIGVLYPEKAKNYTRQGGEYYRNWAGVSQALADQNLVYTQVPEALFDKPELLRRFRVLVLPSTPYLPPAVARHLADFVKAGGALVLVGPVEGRDPFSDAPAAKLPFPGLADSADARDYRPRKYAFGKGRVVVIPGRMGLPMMSNLAQKSHVFHETADFALRRQFAQLVRSLLPDGPAVNVAGLPPKVLVNAFDTTAHDDGTTRRTVRILDCSPGYNEGDAIPETNQPLLFTPIAKRNGSAPVVVTLRGFTAKNARLLSPDRKDALTLQPAVTHGNTRVSIPAGELGRYSILVCE